MAWHGMAWHGMGRGNEDISRCHAMPQLARATLGTHPPGGGSRQRGTSSHGPAQMRACKGVDRHAHCVV